MPRTAKPPEKMSKADLTEGLQRKLSKDELVILFKSVGDGYRVVSPAEGVYQLVGPEPTV